MEEKSFNPYSPGFSIYLYIKVKNSKKHLMLQSLFTWIFYLFEYDNNYSTAYNLLQSLFTWIFYLFELIKSNGE